MIPRVPVHPLPRDHAYYTRTMTCDESATRASSLIDVLHDFFAQREGVDLAILFGSRAKGQSSPGSDVDLAVRGHKVDRLALAADLETTIERSVDIADIDGAGYPLLKALVRDGVLVHEGSSGSYGRFLSHAVSQLDLDRDGYERMRDGYLHRLAARGGSCGR